MGLRAPEWVVNRAGGRGGWRIFSKGSDYSLWVGKAQRNPTSRQHLGLLLDLVGPTQGRLETEEHFWAGGQGHLLGLFWSPFPAVLGSGCVNKHVSAVTGKGGLLD